MHAPNKNQKNEANIAAQRQIAMRAMTVIGRGDEMGEWLRNFNDYRSNGVSKHVLMLFDVFTVCVA